MADKILPQRIRELVPESQAYMDLLAFERKLDQTIMRKRVDIQEALKRPMKQKRKLRLYISNTFNPAKPDAEDSDGSIASWELRVEGKLLDDPSKQKRKFSSFFKSLVIELDKDLYGPDNHLVEWHRTPTTQETDGFQVKRPGDLSVRCTLLLMLDYQPPQFKLDPRLARLLGLHTQSRSAIVQALWQYVKTNRLQDSHDKEYINGDKYFQQVPSPRAWGHGEGKGLCSGTPPCLLDSIGNDLRAGDLASHLGSATTPPCAAACPSQPPHPRGEEGREPQKASSSGEHVLGTWS